MKTRFFLPLCFLLAAHFCSGQTALSLLVADEKGHPIEDAWVEIRSTKPTRVPGQQDVLHTATTDTAGKCVIQFPETGRVNVYVLKKGYQPGNVQGVVMSARKTTYLEKPAVVLVKIPKSRRAEKQKRKLTGK